MAAGVLLSVEGVRRRILRRGPSHTGEGAVRARHLLLQVSLEYWKLMPHMVVWDVHLEVVAMEVEADVLTSSLIKAALMPRSLCSGLPRLLSSPKRPFCQE